MQPIRRALLSVSDKTGLVDLARTLVGFGVELVSTGGTRRTLAAAGLAALDISEVTGFPEMLDGRVKTLHPIIYAGLLARRDSPEHMATIAEHNIAPIDMIVCNLYPFEAVLARGNADAEEIVENIDIGGPTMLRAAAKNFESVAVVTGPDQYEKIVAELHANGGHLTLPTRRDLAKAVFERTARYDATIAAWFASDSPEFPASLTLPFVRRSGLRYGENPHQKAAFYVEPNFPTDSICGAEILHGKELSYNNILDLDSALGLVREFAQPAAAVIKHNNPCGAAIGATISEAFAKSWAGDPQSAFGGVLAMNRPVDAATAELLAEPGKFVECIVAPDFTPEAIEILTTKPTWKKNVRLLKTGPLKVGLRAGVDFRRVDGGLLVQQRDCGSDDSANWISRTRRSATPAELEALHFAWLVCKHVKSNAIVLARDGAIVGTGAGQMSRVDSVQIAIRKAGERSVGSVLASDAFFPFRDNVDAAAAAGIRAIVQPGGSQRDADSIAACDELDLAMLFTAIRHFRH